MNIIIDSLCDHVHQFSFMRGEHRFGLAVIVRVTTRIAYVSAVQGTGVNRRTFRLFHEALTSLGYTEYVSRNRLPFAMGTYCTPGAGWYHGFLTVRIAELDPKIRGRASVRPTPAPAPAPAPAGDWMDRVI